MQLALLELFQYSFVLNFFIASANFSFLCLSLNGCNFDKLILLIPVNVQEQLV